jgi:predicted dehydrogenase
MVRIALLGCGFVSEFYMNGLVHVPRQEIVIAYSRSDERAEPFCRKWGIPRWTTRLEEAIQRDDVDLVIIGLPNQAHREAALMAAAAKKAVVCTKPLARTAPEAKEILDAVREAGVLHGYAETEVFSPAVVKAREMIESGSIGRVLTVRSREAHIGPHAPHFWDPELTGGGALNDMGCHTIEAARYFIGKEVKPVEIMAWGDLLYHTDKTTAEDNAIALMRFANGSMAQMELSWSSHGGLDLRNEVYGTEGAIFTDTTRGTPIRAFTLRGSGYIIEKAEAETGWVQPLPDEARVYGYHGEMLHFVQCVASGTMPRENFEDGYIVNVILDAGYRSMKSKRWEPVEA